MSTCMQCEGMGDGPCLFHLVCRVINMLDTDQYGSVEYVPFWNTYELTLPDGRKYSDLSLKEQDEAIKEVWGSMKIMLDEGRV